jgi:hypothetical protein
MINNYPIRKDIKNIIINNNCVVCGSTKNIVCDHKNNLYNDPRVLNIETQTIEDFQPLCKHHYLQKCKISKKEKEYKKVYSAKEIPLLNSFGIEFPWEKKIYDETDINCKKDTFWYDPVEFNKKIKYHMFKVLPLMLELKQFYNNNV